MKRRFEIACVAICFVVIIVSLWGLTTFLKEEPPIPLVFATNNRFDNDPLPTNTTSAFNRLNLGGKVADFPTNYPPSRWTIETNGDFRAYPTQWKTNGPLDDPYDIGSTVVYAHPRNVFLPPNYAGTVRIGTNVIWPKP